MFYSTEEEKKTEAIINPEESQAEITPEESQTEITPEENQAETTPEKAEEVTEETDTSAKAEQETIVLTAQAMQQLLTNTEKVKELEAYNLRLQADFDNYRRRSQKEREDLSQYASVKVVSALLPILDDFERALAAPLPEGEHCDSLKTGVQMIHRQLLEVLAKEGLQEIESLGQLFDPYVHEAVMQCEATEGIAENTVTMVLRKGYKMKEKVIRAAMVQVAHK
ncbi:MAG: nucleotide exchange factor GrpE [Negativicutes bacterium]|nr:nucleotide exchange factor GrpE [Negativicutes bacterium]